MVIASRFGFKIHPKQMVREEESRNKHIKPKILLFNLVYADFSICAVQFGSWEKLDSTYTLALGFGFFSSHCSARENSNEHV